MASWKWYLFETISGVIVAIGAFGIGGFIAGRTEGTFRVFGFALCVLGLFILAIVLRQILSAMEVWNAW